MFIFSALDDGDKKKQVRQIVRQKYWPCHASSLSANERKRNKKQKRERVESREFSVAPAGDEFAAKPGAGRRRFARSS
jgi:hypothetical protein